MRRLAGGGPTFVRKRRDPPGEPDPDFVGSPVYLLMDPTSWSVLHDRDNWLTQQPAGERHMVVHERDASAMSLALATGEGLNGGNAVRVTLDQHSTNQGGFEMGMWLFHHQATGGSYLNPSPAYMLRDFTVTTVPNRFEYFMRFPDPSNWSDASTGQPPEYPHSRNMNIGTYHSDNGSVENNNWHFYYQLYTRQDLQPDGDTWIHFVCNQRPQAQRGGGEPHADNPTSPTNLWENLTRLYIEMLFSPDTFPAVYYIDKIALTYVDDSTPTDDSGQSSATYVNRSFSSDYLEQRRWSERPGFTPDHGPADSIY